MKVSDITIVVNIMNITTNINIDIIHLLNLKPDHYRHHHHQTVWRTVDIFTLVTFVLKSQNY